MSFEGMPAVVSAHEKLGRRAVLVQGDTPFQPVFQHVAGNAIGLYLAAQHDDAVHILQVCRLFRGQNGALARAPDTGVYRKHSSAAQNPQAQA